MAGDRALAVVTGASTVKPDHEVQAIRDQQHTGNHPTSAAPEAVGTDVPSGRASAGPDRLGGTRAGAENGE